MNQNYHIEDDKWPKGKQCHTFLLKEIIIKVYNLTKIVTTIRSVNF